MGHVGQAYGIRLGISRFWSYKKISRAFFINEYLFNLFYIYTKRLFKHRHWINFGIIFNKAFCFVEERKVVITVLLYDLAIERASKRIYLRQRRQKKNFRNVNMFYRYKLKHSRVLNRIRKNLSVKQSTAYWDYNRKSRVSYLTNYSRFSRKYNKWTANNLIYAIPSLNLSKLKTLYKNRPKLFTFDILKQLQKCGFDRRLLKKFLARLYKRIISSKNYPSGHRQRVNAFLNNNLDVNDLFEMPTFDIRPNIYRNFFRRKPGHKLFPRLKHYQIRKLRGYRYIQRILFKKFRAPAYKHLWSYFLRLVVSNRLLKRDVDSHFEVRVVNVPAYKITAFALAAFALRRLRYEDKVNAIFRPILRKLRKMVQGVRILCCGRFTRRQRASRALFSHGKISQSKLSVPVDFQFSSIPLKYGVGSIKIWLVKK